MSSLGLERIVCEGCKKEIVSELQLKLIGICVVDTEQGWNIIYRFISRHYMENINCDRGRSPILLHNKTMDI